MTYICPLPILTHHHHHQQQEQQQRKESNKIILSTTYKVSIMYYIEHTYLCMPKSHRKCYFLLTAFKEKYPMPTKMSGFDYFMKCQILLGYLLIRHLLHISRMTKDSKRTFY